MALNSISDVDERFIIKVNKFWWAYRIALEFNLDPRQVKNWDSDDILEALAAIGLHNKPPAGGEQ